MPNLVESAIEQATKQLWKAAQEHTPCDPVHGLLEASGLEGAYSVQQYNISERLSRGRKVVGHKIGLTAISVQKQLGVDQPDYGTLLDDMEYGDLMEIPMSRFLQPKVEAEIAFVIDRDLDDSVVSFSDVVRSIAYAVPAIEIVDSRVRDWKITILDTIADNASSGSYVLGGTPRKIDQLDLRLCGMSLENRGEPVVTGCGAACLGNPLNAVTWLAQRLIVLGKPLRAGQVVLSGALGPMVPVQAGEVYEARISGLGNVSAVFGKE